MSRISTYYIGNLSNISKESLVITNGATEAIHLALNASLTQVDTVAIESPTYYGYFDILNHNALKCVEIPIKESMGLDLEILEKSILESKIKAIHIQPRIQNPTTWSYTTKNKKELLLLCRKYNVLIIEDDVYGDLTPDQTCKPIGFYTNEKDKYIYINSFSKTISPALRIGFIHTNYKLSEIVINKTILSMSTNEFGQKLLNDLFKRKVIQKHFKNISKTLLKIQEDARSFFNSSNIQVAGSSGGYLIWLKISKGNSMEFFHKLIAEGIAIAPGKIFSDNTIYYKYIRINIAGFNDLKVRQQLKKIRDIINADV